ncbi:hypothetical protein BWK63_10260 [Flavobacterium covae]|uniref:Uncharacterized protein n=1 Tax=Flavobacterium covae TaxID=2906076 RepID=A0ABW8PJL9_9FLAO|nr:MULTISPECIES: hypothetical protein [Flavobacterium]OWP80592.1 hypothetical protein BWK63_10260 [Flavobacterium covae]POR20527.1 hypothetical protein BWK57_13225 [Flavobacterium columnare]
MKIIFNWLFLFTNFYIWSQKPCELALNIKDSISVIKQTKSCTIYEKVFGGKTTLIFLSLISTNGIPSLKLEHLQKSQKFETPICFDKSSKIIFQLSNGRIYTLLYGDNDRCDDLIYNEKERINNRFIESNFFFLKDDLEELKKYPISFMRINFAGTSTDYVIRKELDCETLVETYFPAQFFIDHFNCISN